MLMRSCGTLIETHGRIGTPVGRPDSACTGSPPSMTMLRAPPDASKQTSMTALVREWPGKVHPLLPEQVLPVHTGGIGSESWTAAPSLPEEETNQARSPRSLQTPMSMSLIRLRRWMTRSLQLKRPCDGSAVHAALAPLPGCGRCSVSPLTCSLRVNGAASQRSRRSPAENSMAASRARKARLAAQSLRALGRLAASSRFAISWSSSSGSWLS